MASSLITNGIKILTQYYEDIDLGSVDSVNKILKLFTPFARYNREGDTSAPGILTGIEEIEEFYTNGRGLEGKHTILFIQPKLEADTLILTSRGVFEGTHKDNEVCLGFKDVWHFPHKNIQQTNYRNSLIKKCPTIKSAEQWANSRIHSSQWRIPR